MKKIVFGITSLRPGGAERVLVDICNRLKDQYDINVFTLYGDGEFAQQLDSKIHQVSLHPKKYESYSKFKKLWFSIQLLIPFLRNKVYKTFFHNQYDVQIAFLEGPITWLMSVKEDVKKFVWVHNDLICTFGSGILNHWKRKMSYSDYKRYQKVIFVSQDNVKSFEQLYPNNSFEKQVIYNYIDIASIIEKSNLEDVSDMKEDMLNFVVVSRLTEQKGLSRLIDGHQRLIQDGYFHRIYIVGDGPLRESLQEKIKELQVEDTFILLGQRKNPYPYIKKADYFLLASLYEGYGMVLIEAKVLNKYILLTDTAAREAVEGYENYLLMENNEQGIYDGIKKVVETKPIPTKNKPYQNEEIIYDIINLIEK